MPTDLPMTQEPTQDLIRYDVLVQEALRSVVRKVLQEVAKTGLPGQHHFYISFDTRHPGVRLSTRMRQRYPEEMTIVLQHQYWDLVVTDHAVEVGLSFGGIPERLLVPFTAVKGFFDPSVQFGLQFELSGEIGTDDDEEPGEADATAAAPVPGPRMVPTEASKVPEIAPAAKPAPVQAETPPSAAETQDAPSAGATVISMDSFRKKT